MTDATLPSSALLPPRDADLAGLGRAAGLALLAHALLIAALSAGLNWRLRPPETVYAAELWSAVPQVAAPAPVEPAPAPPPAPPPPPRVERQVAPPPVVAQEAQIAIERERKRKLEQQRADEERRQQAREDKLRADKLKEDRLRVEKLRAEKLREDKLREEKLRAEKLKEDKLRKDAAAQRERQADDERVARQREANLARIRGMAGATGGPSATGSAARDAAPSDAYAGRIRARVKPNILLTSEVSGNPVAVVEVRCAPDGTIIGRRILKRSGSEIWDDTVLRALDRTEVLPRDVDGRVPPTMELAFRRE